MNKINKLKKVLDSYPQKFLKEKNQKKILAKAQNFSCFATSFLTTKDKRSQKPRFYLLGKLAEASLTAAKGSVRCPLAGVAKQPSTAKFENSQIECLLQSFR